jgi:hypothetical protein
MPAQGNVVAHQLDIIIGETNLHTRFVAAGLLRRAPREHSHRCRPETFEDGLDGFAEAVPVGKQQNYSCNSLRHPRHREQGTAQVMAHGRVRLL